MRRSTNDNLPPLPDHTIEQIWTLILTRDYATPGEEMAAINATIDDRLRRLAKPASKAYP
jgi:hypothetical protein